MKKREKRNKYSRNIQQVSDCIFSSLVDMCWCRCAAKATDPGPIHRLQPHVPRPSTVRAPTHSCISPSVQFTQTLLLIYRLIYRYIDKHEKTKVFWRLFFPGGLILH